MKKVVLFVISLLSVSNIFSAAFERMIQEAEGVRGTARTTPISNDTKRTITQSTGIRDESVEPMIEAVCTVSYCCDARTSQSEARSVVEKKLSKSNAARKKEIHSHIAKARASQNSPKMDDVVLATVKMHEELKAAPRRK